MKGRLVESHAHRRARIESGEETVVGVNAFTTSEPNPLLSGRGGSVQRVDPAVEAQAVADLARWREQRDPVEVGAALVELETTAGSDANLMPATLRCARAGVTTGEWSGALRRVFGEYRAPTGVAGVVGMPTGDPDLAAVRADVLRTGKELGSHLRLLVGKPGLDGHSNGAEQIAVRARDVGFEVIYQGIRLTPAQLVAAAVEEDVHCIGLSILSGSHMSVVPEVVQGLREAGMGEVPVVVGGIIPESDAVALRAAGVADVFTPKDYDITVVMGRIVTAIRRAHGL
jgi:(2R)-ethylmalonyl-CoA mutase